MTSDGIVSDGVTSDGIVRGAIMRSEIAEQPDRWLDLLAGQREAIDAAAGLIRDDKPELLVFIARGSSDHAAMYGQYLAHNLLRIPAMLATPATVTAFGTQLRYPSAVAIAVSQSGQSPDLIETASSIVDTGVPLVSLTNDARSGLAGLARIHVPLSAGPEVSVAATKTYTAELLAIALILLRASGESWSSIEARVAALVDVVRDGLAQPIDHLVAALDGRQRVLVVGRGYSMSSAREGALKLMETNAIAASGWSAADATHGPLGQVVPGSAVVVLTAGTSGRASVLSFAEAAAALGGDVVEVGAGLVPGAVARIDVPSSDELLTPIAEIIPLQRLALELAVGRGLDPDTPVGLRKVTLTH